MKIVSRTNNDEQQQSRLQVIDEVFSTGAGYDEALDHATADFMDAFLAGGDAVATSDGGMYISATSAFSKEDLKPLVRQAINSWVRLKMN